MKLLQLSSDNPKFKTINFLPGLNIVAGLQLSAEDKKTINGIGKSLSLNLIHYILGANLEDNKLKNYLKDYGSFFLSFIHNDIKYLISKNFKDNQYYINNDKFESNKKYLNELNNIFSSDKQNLSFRQIFNCFARRFGGSYYTDVLYQQGMNKNDYHQHYVNFALLGIDTQIVEEKYIIKERITNLDKASTLIKEYEKTLEKTNIKDLEDEIINLNKQKDEFLISPNYDKMKREADSLTLEMNDLRNEIFKKENRLKKLMIDYNESVNINIDVKTIEDLYNEASFHFENKIKKSIEDAQNFHTSLIQNRRKRFQIEISELNITLNELKTSLETISKKRDKILKDLNNSGAFEEYNALVQRINVLDKEKENLEKYKNILIEFKKEKSSLNTKNTAIKEKSINYIEKSSKMIEEKENIFRGLVKRFYDNHGGSLKLQETKDAKYLFDINVSIPKEGSQGVGGVKIFCYDVLLYLLNKNVLNFLAHDSCIFSGMDPRQESIIFKIILELIKDYDLQYFININENTINEILNVKNQILDDEEKSIIKKSIRLELYDKDPKNWLFGESFG